MNLRPPATLPPTTAAGTYSDLNGLAALKKEPNSPRAIHALAQQVDALFLQMMLKSMRDAASDTGEQQSNEMGIYQDMFDKQVALSLSAHQDLGLGAQLTRHMAALAAMTDPSGTDAQRPVAAPAVAAPAAAAAVSEAGAAECDVRVGGAADVERVGVGEHGLVAVGRDVPEHDLVAGGDLLVAQDHVGRGLASEVHHR